MKNKKMSKSISRLFSVGILFVTVPNLFRGEFAIPDFFRGFFLGIGLGLMITGIIRQKRQAALVDEQNTL